MALHQIHYLDLMLLTIILLYITATNQTVCGKQITYGYANFFPTFRPTKISSHENKLFENCHVL